jgi:UDP-N-acetylglucosamine enolpyruvyl transferase
MGRVLSYVIRIGSRGRACYAATAKVFPAPIFAGIAMLIAALCGRTTVIHNIGQIDRGYEILRETP